MSRRVGLGGRRWQVALLLPEKRFVYNTSRGELAHANGLIAVNREGLFVRSKEEGCEERSKFAN